MRKIAERVRYGCTSWNKRLNSGCAREIDRAVTRGNVRAGTGSEPVPVQTYLSAAGRHNSSGVLDRSGIISRFNNQ